VDDDITAVIKAADQAVYNAKATGREQGINFSMTIRAPLLHFWSQNGCLIVVEHKAFQGNLLGRLKLTEFETVDGQPIGTAIVSMSRLTSSVLTRNATRTWSPTGPNAFDTASDMPSGLISWATPRPSYSLHVAVVA